ncbi:MAG: hypothetical protein GY861_24885 [bacterium]|nr:hypothetical protein [bacterium]
MGLIGFADNKIKKMSVLDFSILKIALVIIGMIIGAYVSTFVKQYVYYFAGVFVVLYAILIYKVLIKK